MRKKLNLVLREPVRLHENFNSTPTLPSHFESLKEAQTVENEPVIETDHVKNPQPSIKVSEPNRQQKPIIKSGSKSLRVAPLKSDNLRDLMTLRTQQIWDYLCEVAKGGEKVNRSLTITRAQIMREAGIGSTNTYRDAMQKFQDLELIEIELRPGVNAGSTFHFTKRGLEQIEIQAE